MESLETPETSETSESLYKETPIRKIKIQTDSQFSVVSVFSNLALKLGMNTWKF